MASQKKSTELEHEKVERFLKDTFHRYLLNYDGFFLEENENGEFVPLPLYKNGEIQKDILSKSAKILGLNENDILSCNVNAARKWYRKFPFFELLNQFNVCRDLSFGEEVGYRNDREKALQYIKSVCEGYIVEEPKSYDSDYIRERMVDMLKNANELLPGTYHEGATIEDFSFRTNNFFSFPKIGALIGSFMYTVSRLKELFFKAWKTSLEETEIKEYNFLVTTLDVVDNLTAICMYYDNLKKLIPVFLSEGFKGENEEFFDIVHLKFCSGFEPWKCKEFAEDSALAQYYTSCYPRAKREMFEFGRAVKYFICAFRWSDTTFPNIDIEEDWDNIPPGDFLNEFEDWTKQYINREANYEKIGVKNEFGTMIVRVPKTSQELENDEKYLKKLIRLGGIVSKGGVRTPKIKHVSWEERKESFIARLAALKGGTL